MLVVGTNRREDTGAGAVIKARPWLQKEKVNMSVAKRQGRNPQGRLPGATMVGGESME